MKTLKNCLFVVLAATCLISSNLYAQEEVEKESPFNIGADIYSNYVWRGTKIGTGPAFQPSISYGIAGLTVGAWGSFDAMGFAEADLYAAYEFDFGLSLGITDYYLPGTDYFNYSDTAGNHAFELNAVYSLKGFTLSGNYIFNEAPGIASMGGDTYIELAYDFANFSLFAGAGNGWYTVEDLNADGKAGSDEFGLVNIGISTSKDIKITDSFSLPICGSVILNPQAEFFTMVLGVSF